MTPERLRAAIRLGVYALVLIAPLPFASVEPGAVLAIELAAALLGLLAILLIGRDDDARAAVPRVPLAIGLGLIGLGIFQIVPLPFALAEKFNPTAELLRPLIPYLGLDHPPTVAWSVAAPETMDALLRLTAYVLIGLAAAVAFDDTRSRRTFAAVLVTSAVFQAVYGSGEYLSGRQHIFAYAKKYYLDSATGTFINRNHFATFLAMALPFALALAIPGASRATRHRGWRERVLAAASSTGLARLLALAACALLWLGLLLSHSRAGLVAAVAGAAIVLYRYRSARAAKWAAALGAAVLLLLLTMQVARAPGERFLALGDDITAKGGRLEVWRDSLGLIAQRPILGWGYGTFESAFPTVQSAAIATRYDHAHNDWLQWMVEGGVLAFGGAVAMLWLVLRRSRASATAGFDAACALAAKAAVVAVAVHALWDFSLRMPAVAVAGATIVVLGRPRVANFVPGLSGTRSITRTDTVRSGQMSIVVASPAGDSARPDAKVDVGKVISGS